MRKLILLSSVFFAAAMHGFGQQQSAIYDATAIMNARFGLNVLLVPQPATEQDAFKILNALTGAEIAILKDSSDNFDLAGTVTRSSAAADPKAIILEILRRNANLAVGSSETDIMREYIGNPFLSDILTYTPPTLLASTNIESIKGFTASNVSGANVGANLLGNVVNGTADFLIKRAHEELSISVIDKLKKMLELHPEFLKLFPRTCALLEPVKPYEYSKALAAFKAAIKEDMDNFIANISSLYDIPRYQLLNDRVPAISLLFTASTLLSETQDEKSFAASMASLPSKSFMGATNNYTAVVRLLTVISNSLLDQSLADPNDKPLRYIDKLYISRVTHNDPAMMTMLSRVYLGLLWHKAKGIQFVTSAGTQNIETFLTRWNASASIEDVIKLVDKVVGFISTADKDLQEVKESEQETRKITGENHTIVKRFTHYATLVSGVLDMLKLFEDPASTSNAATRLGEIRVYLPQFTTSVSAMIKNISEKEYNLAISSFEQTLTVLSDYLKTIEKNKNDATILKDTVEAVIANEIDAVDVLIASVNTNISSLGSGGTTAEQIERQARRQEYLAQKAELEEKQKQLKGQKKDVKAVVFSLPKIFKYINLLAGISKAENSEAVEKLLETYALPAGSSRIKKVTSFNIAVNSYVGGFFGRSGISESGLTNHYGLTTPIGFTISTGFDKAGSISLFISAFDIGGTVKYKLNNQGKYEQNISLAGIISPGVHFVYGFPFYLPVSFGLGCQGVSPVTENENKIHLKFSFNAFIGVDIPLFNLTRSK